MDIKGFKQQIKKGVAEFNKINPSETIKVISHLDTDGICASAIILKALNLENRKYSVSIVQQLDEQEIKSIVSEDYKHFIFTDIGAGQVDLIAKYLNDRNVFILDHHKPAESDFKGIHINPHFSDIDGSQDISGSGVVYFFASELNSKIEEMAHIALIGAIGDIQDREGFSILNQAIINTAVEKNNLKVVKGLKLFGVQTRPLHKVLEYCTDPVIPGVSGSESGAIQFLKEIGIDPKQGKSWRKLVHLDKDEMKKLAEAIVLKRLDQENPDSIIGEVYILKQEKRESPLRDAKEFSTLLNACGRMGRASLGIGTCLGDEKMKQRALNTLKEYRSEIVGALKWYDSNKKSKCVTSKQGYIIINAQDNIRPSIIGTMASIISYSRKLESGTFILSMAQNFNNKTKISIRISGNPEVCLNNIISNIIESLGKGIAGGHKMAAGAIIPSEEEKEFIEIAKTTLSKLTIEEKVC
ncbi:MAG: hypothetical protein MAG795_00579 [Candidatus Woesearchaeota archaeon]|nr:hypothetical protein [Candidatus Woesearchaeota archaeon]